MSKESREERRLRRLEARVGRDESKLASYRRFAIWGGGLVLLAVLAFMAVKFASPSSTPSSKDIVPAPISAEDWLEGPENAPYTLLEYSDFECPACRAVQPMLKEVLGKMSGKIRFVYRHFPLKMVHSDSLLAARAAEAAGKQGKFWEMHDVLFDKQDEWVQAKDGPESFFKAYAEQLGLDPNRFQADYQSKEIITKIDAAYDTALKLGLDHTPTFFVNGRLIENPRDANELEASIQGSAPVTQ